MKVALDSCLSRVALAREVIITAAETKIRDGRLVDETSLGFACGAVEALLTEIRLWRSAERERQGLNGGRRPDPVRDRRARRRLGDAEPARGQQRL